MIEIKFKKLHPNAILPRYAHGPDEDAGLDLVAVEDVLLYEFEPTLVKTGLALEMPSGVEAQIRPRSGLALKSGITVYNSPGTIDSSYRGELGVILWWSPTREQRPPFALREPLSHKVSAGERICQVVFSSYLKVGPSWSETLAESKRGDGGFGSSGVV